MDRYRGTSRETRRYLWLPADVRPFGALVKEIPLSGDKGSGYVALVNDEDFDRVSPLAWWLSDRNPTKLQVRGAQGRTRILLSHFILPGHKFIRHLDGDGLNNTRENLHPLTDPENGISQSLSKANTSGLKGVWWAARDKKWMAMVSCRPKHIHLGSFPDRETAGYAYDRKAVEIYGEHAMTNQRLGLLPYRDVSLSHGI
jgi:AP2 domain